MEGGPPSFPQGFTCPAVLWIQLDLHSFFRKFNLMDFHALPFIHELIARKVKLILEHKQKTAYEMCVGDWSSDVCSSDLYNNSPDHSTKGTPSHINVL